MAEVTQDTIDKHILRIYHTLQCLLLQDVYSALNIHPSASTRNSSHLSAPARDSSRPSAALQDSPPPLIRNGAVDASIVHSAAPAAGGLSRAKAKEHVYVNRPLQHGAITAITGVTKVPGTHPVLFPSS